MCCKKFPSIHPSNHPSIIQARPTVELKPYRSSNCRPPTPYSITRASVYLGISKLKSPKQTDSLGICNVPWRSKSTNVSFKTDTNHRYSLRTLTLNLATLSSLLFSCKMPIILSTSSLARMRVGSKGRRWDWFRRTSAMTCCSASLVFMSSMIINVREGCVR